MEALLTMHPEMDAIEREIILMIIEDALQTGYEVTVCDGAENVIENSTSKAAIFAAMFSTGADTLFFDDQDGKQADWIFLVYGNRQDVVSDCADNEAMEALLKNVDTLIEETDGYGQAEYEADDNRTCVNCLEYAKTKCDGCKQPLCFDCNQLLNEKDPGGDGYCWTCREKRAGTYNGE